MKFPGGPAGVSARGFRAGGFRKRRSVGDAEGHADVVGQLARLGFSGKVNTHYVRTSLTWLKLGGEWRIVDQHVSRLPMP